MDNFVDERDYELLNKDKHTFSVMIRIIGLDCELRLTDHKDIILCFTSQPYPVWIWTEDDASEEVMERAYLTAKENSLLDGEHNFNMKYSLADYFIKRAEKDGVSLSIKTNMFAYECPESIPPKTETDGKIHQCTMDDMDVLVDFYEMMHNTIGIDKESREQYRNKAEEFVKNGTVYFWENADGEFVTSCNWRPIQNMASIGLVYTREEFRRHHYAENLVYQVSEIARKAGYTPKLYTDADYVASNACYEKIGYILRGKLCLIG
jgi:hypothetical protein